MFSSASQSKEQEQLRPKVWMGAHMLKDPNHELKEKKGRFCDVCTPTGDICHSSWVDNSNCTEN